MLLSKGLRIFIAVAALVLAVVIVKIWGANGIDGGWEDKEATRPIEKIYRSISSAPSTVDENYMEGYYISEEDMQALLDKRSAETDNEETTANSSSDDAVENSAFWDSNAHWLAMALQVESGINWPDWAVMIIGDVILNRVDSPRFPNTIREVLLDPGQYSPFMGNFEMFMPETRYIMLAERLLEGEHSLKDREIVYQSLFEQGSVTVVSYYDEVLDTTTYFCK